MPNPSAISTLGDLRRAIERGEVRRRSVHVEVRDNLIEKLRGGGTLFPGIVGYDETVLPQLVNALLSRHHFILLGLRGQAKTRLLRAQVAEAGDRTPIGWLERDARYVEKLATPDVTIADMIGDIDPIKAARAG